MAPVATALAAAGVLLSAPCKEMLKSIDIEAKAITAGVSECLEKELSSDGKDDIDIAALHELETWAHRAQDLSKDAALLAPVLPAHLKQLGAELRAHSDYVRTLRSEVQGRVFARREKAYSAVLADQHEIVTVPADGNCFFWSAFVAKNSLEPRDEHYERNAELTFMRAQQLIASDCLDKVHALRSHVCQYMRENIPSLRQDMIRSCLEALSQQTASALRSNLIEQLGSCIQLQMSGSWDGTEDALCACAHESLHSTANTTEDAILEACEIYCRTYSGQHVLPVYLSLSACLSLSPPLPSLHTHTPFLSPSLPHSLALCVCACVCVCVCVYVCVCVCVCVLHIHSPEQVRSILLVFLQNACTCNAYLIFGAELSGCTITQVASRLPQKAPLWPLPRFSPPLAATIVHASRAMPQVWYPSLSYTTRRHVISMSSSSWRTSEPAMLRQWTA